MAKIIIPLEEKQEKNQAERLKDIFKEAYKNGLTSKEEYEKTIQEINELWGESN